MKGELVKNLKFLNIVIFVLTSLNVYTNWNFDSKRGYGNLDNRTMAECYDLKTGRKCDDEIVPVKTIQETINQIRKDYNATNNYKNYDIFEEETGSTEHDLSIKKYYRNGELKKVVTFGDSGRVAETTEYYIKNGQTYFKHFIRKIHYNGTSRDEERYYYDRNGNLVRFIDSSGKIYEDEDGLYGDYGYYGSGKWED